MGPTSWWLTRPTPGAPATATSRVATATPATTVSSQIRARMVTLARSQIGYNAAPWGTYCNKFSGYWYSGAANCAGTDRSEQWCADFAAWVWKLAGAEVTFAFINGDLNSSSASFYEWGVRHHTWHAASSGYVAQPGDVAVYGLDIARLVAQHVAVVVSVTAGEAGPNAVNGDSSATGGSSVVYQAHELDADIASHAVLSGYVSPSAR